MITNGYLLTAERIQRLNRAGLEHLQISIDNVMPDEVSKKSLKVLDKKLQLLAEHAEFHVNINSVVGGGIQNPHDALVVGKRAVELGFTSTVGIIHDGDGQLQPLRRRSAKSTPKCAAWKRAATRRSIISRTTSRRAKRIKWRCRAGSRYLYICEDGLVHYCSQQRGYPAKPLSRIHGGGHPARVPHGKILRAAVHGGVRAPDFVHGFLARTPISRTRRHGATRIRAFGPDSIVDRAQFPRFNGSCKARERLRERSAQQAPRWRNCRASWAC